ncbi:MAG: T9SS type A sorting domain-containing protein, partial [Winogradskyella sp.]|uniref:T9SS type A sorting domain-containing protein n=1 Tax=Winogradskyella sp. TaxID=1883156 RepID=UPI0017E85B37|nr:T9SS type A sorting domain-containing protein [Winogradskyella sp.]
MKTKLLTLLAFLLVIKTYSQTDGWYLYTKASEITKIVPDDVNGDELHIATDIGYLKYNTTSATVTDHLNLTSQNPAIGNVKDIALDPTSNDIAMTLKNGIAIYSMGDVTVYNYADSGLSIGENTNQFYYLQAEYAKDGSLYIFKEDALGYQKFNDGLFEPETVTSFMPQDIVENSAGTKAYFAGVNDGLWELDKGTMDWTNYTSSNSDLISNFVLSCHVDMNDLLYIGGFQGLNTLSSSGAWNTYQGLDPINAFPYQVHDISIDEATGDLVIKTSGSNTYYYGLTMLDLNTNTWTNYREDGTNCLNENVYNAATFGGNGKVYAAPSLSFASPEIGKLVEFIPASESCSDININYLNAPVAVNSNVISDFNVREKTNGNLEIGFTRTFGLHTAEIDPTTFNGTFPTATTLTPSPGSQVFSVLNDNNYFIVETDEGWHFIDENNNITTFNHNIPDYLALITKKAANYNSDNGIINIVHKGFDVSYNYRVYKTQCDIFAGACAASEEIFTTNRDLTQNVLFDVNESQISDEVHAVAIQTAASPPSLASSTTIHQNPDDPLFTSEFWVRNTNGQPFPVETILLDILFPTKDPVTVLDDLGNPRTAIIHLGNMAIQILSKSEGSDDYISEEKTFDLDNDGEIDEILSIGNLYIDGLSNELLVIIKNSAGIFLIMANPFDEQERTFHLISNLNQEIELPFSEPKDIIISKFLILENPGVGTSSQNNDMATIALSTNYGLLLKTDLDLSQLTLSDDDVALSDTSFNLIPNPSNDMVSFSDKTITTASLYDLNGRHIMNIESQSFSVKDVSKGIYIVKATTQNGATISSKLIKN